LGVEANRNPSGGGGLTNHKLCSLWLLKKPLT
jgi:hypothetical protein